MKKVVFISFVMCTGYIFAQTEVLPKSPFDENTARIQMERGSSSISGKVVANEGLGGKAHFAPAGTKVFIYPLTPYIEEYVALRKRYLKNSDYVVYLDEIPGRYRRETEVINRDGEYEFRDLKPGKYMLTSEVRYVGIQYVQVPAGQTVYMKGNTVVGYGGTQYSSEKRHYENTEYETVIVTIKKDGDRKRTNL